MTQAFSIWHITCYIDIICDAFHETFSGTTHLDIDSKALIFNLTFTCIVFSSYQTFVFRQILLQPLYSLQTLILFDILDILLYMFHPVQFSCVCQRLDVIFYDQYFIEYCLLNFKIWVVRQSRLSRWSCLKKNRYEE